ncbi:hypothetical protein D3C80_1561900 [compost metagenome]
MLDMQVADLLLIEQLQELAIRDGLHGWRVEQAELHGSEHRQANCQKVELPGLILVHGHLSSARWR